jgi:hypothetical protein
MADKLTYPIIASVRFELRSQSINATHSANFSAGE